MAIFVLTTTMPTTDGQTDCPTPCGVNMDYLANHVPLFDLP